jgi:hypothetical protein
MENMTEEQYMELLQLGGDNAKLEELMRMQMAQAEAMQAQAQPPRMRGNSRVQVAPHFLELLGGLAQSKAANVLQNRAIESSGKRADNQTAQNNAIMQAILRQRQMQPAAPPGGTGFMPPQPKSPYSLGGM